MIELEPCSHTVPLRGPDRPVSDFLDSVCDSKVCGGHESQNKETKRHYKSAFGKMERQTDKRMDGQLAPYHYMSIKG